MAVVLAPSTLALANEVSVDVRTLKMNDLATITVTLEGAFAANDSVEVPLQNLSFVGEPSVSSEFAWINGDVTRRKVFRYRARPIAPGPARVGPIQLSAEDGQAERLHAIALTIEADRAAATNDAAQILRELRATGRDVFFVVAEIEKPVVYEGEPVVITWVMYNGSSVQQWQVVNIPRLADFWSEELTREERPERVYVADVMVQRMPIRRVALYPLRSGRLRVEGMTVEAAIMRGTRRGPFSMYEGVMVETAFTSAPVDLEVKPIPPGEPVDAVGDFALTCEPPFQRGDGPVVMRVALVGRGNARAALAAQFEHPVEGTLQIEGGAVTVDRDSPGGEMTRRWNYLIFPSTAGPLEIPQLTLRTFAPSKNARHELRCGRAFLDVVATRLPEAAKSAVPAAEVRRPIPWRWIGAGTAILIAALIAFPLVSRELAVRREARDIVADATPAEIRARVEARVPVGTREASDRGDAWRALRSLLDATERERDIAVDAENELVRRVRDVLRFAEPRRPSI